jgi:hypothetical protein
VTAAGDPALARRQAAAEICLSVSSTVVERVVTEATRAANLLGFGRDAAKRYGDGIRETLPFAFKIMALPDGSEREAGLARLAAMIRGVSEQNRIPQIVERGLVAIAFRVARELVRHNAPEKGFTPDELEQEFIAFADRLEGLLFKTT